MLFLVNTVIRLHQNGAHGFLACVGPEDERILAVWVCQHSWFDQHFFDGFKRRLTLLVPKARNVSILTFAFALRWFDRKEHLNWVDHVTVTGTISHRKLVKLRNNLTSDWFVGFFNALTASTLSVRIDRLHPEISEPKWTTFFFKNWHFSSFSL